MIDHGTEYMTEGTAYILFLETYENVPADLLNPQTAAFIVENNGDIRPQHSQNNFTLQREHLINIE